MVEILLVNKRRQDDVIVNKIIGIVIAEDMKKAHEKVATKFNGHVYHAPHPPPGHPDNWIFYKDASGKGIVLILEKAELII